MSKKKKEEQEEKKEERPEVKFGPKVEKQVLEQLGKPPGFIQIRAKHVFDDKFRVDVWADANNSNSFYRGRRIVDSFFIKASAKGIISSSPPIEKKYAVDVVEVKVEDDVIAEAEMAPAISVGPVAQSG